MKYLFVHQNFPGQFLHLLQHLLKNPDNSVVFISEPNQNQVRGVRRAFYQTTATEQEATHPNARDYDLQARRAAKVAETAGQLKRLGYEPDIIIGHHGWGELLNLPDIWPNAPILGYFEFYYRTNGQDVGYDAEFPVDEQRFARIRAMNVVNLLALSLEQHGQTPTHWQRTRYPLWAQPTIRVISEGAHLDICKPDRLAARADFAIGDFVVAPKDRLVTYVARNLEPYRGFHTMMRTLPRLLRERSDLKVIIVGGDEVSYGARLAHGTWRELLQRELAGQYDESRVLFPGQVSYQVYVKMLQRSDAHLYLSYPFVASWSLREALACGCLVIGADVEPVAEFITHQRNGLLVPGLDHDRIADAVLAALADPRGTRKLRLAARAYAERTLRMEDHIARYESVVAEITGRG